MNAHTVIAFVAYFSLLLILGLTVHRKSTNEADFVMGGRGLNFWLTAMSAHASDMSAWLFMAFPMAVWLGGPVQCWIGIGLLLGMFLTWQFVAPKLRQYTEELDAYTLSTFFERRFKDTSGWVRTLTASMTLLFMTHYLAAGLIAMGLLLESIFGLEYHFGITVATLVAVSYTFVGGYVTVAWMDLFQGTFLLIVILIVPVMAFATLPEGAITQAAAARDLPMSLLPDMSGSWFIEMFILCFGWGIGYFGLPHVLTKFMGIRSVNDISKAKYVGMSWQLIAILASAAIGIIGIAFFPNGLDDPQLVFVDMVHILFHPLMAGFVLCAVIAANMSTMDSQILVCATVISEDFCKRFSKKKLSSKRLLKFSRIGVVSIAFLALAIALYRQSDTLMETVQYSWAGLGCTFGPLVLMALYYPKTNRYGAITGIILGGLFAALWPTVNPWITSYVMPATVPGFGLCLAAIYLVTRFTSKHATA